MPMDAGRALTQAQIIFNTLENEILPGVLRPGTPVDEVGAAERFSVSRTPVREALS
jgi:DNA-binding GntR family transcriptional regulator